MAPDQGEPKTLTARNVRKAVTGQVVKPEIYWCPTCNVPLLSPVCGICGRAGKYCSADLKPVFPEERLLFERLLRTSGELPPGGNLPKELYIHRGRVIWQGRRLFEFRVKGGKFVLKSRLALSPRDFEPGCDSFIQRAIEANQTVLMELESEATEFIRMALNEFPDAKPIVAFSGGKDSAATAHLVSQVVHPTLFFSNTTMEYPETCDYISSFAESFGWELRTEEPDTDFFTMCEQLDPPSRILRWCCSVFKGSLLSRFLNGLEYPAVNFDGIRRWESNRRRQYDRATYNPKVVKQVTFRPIIDWTSLDVWLYNFWHSLPVNPLYLKGFARVGCYPCPNNTEFEDFLTAEYYPDLWAAWQQRLLRFFEESYSSSYQQGDRDAWLLEGLWKKRMPHRETEYSTVSRSCLEQKGLLFELSKPLDNRLVQFFRPLGEVRLFEAGSQTALSLSRTDWYQVSGVLNSNDLTAVFLNGKGYRSKVLIQHQLRKWLNCVQCGACTGACPNGAIRIREGSLEIASELCTQCQKCIENRFTKQGCVALSYKTHSVRIREDK